MKSFVLLLVVTLISILAYQAQSATLSNVINNEPVLQLNARDAPWWCNAAVQKCVQATDDPCCRHMWTGVSDACYSCKTMCPGRC